MVEKQKAATRVSAAKENCNPEYSNDAAARYGESFAFCDGATNGSSKGGA
ncbi:hypothetical protein LGN24_07335 [Burkholderia seminalis]|nr:hypothetical protein [Burkholderia seminalis]MCA8301295.1 hypothetical protein [Burkholderia seminalis]